MAAKVQVAKDFRVIYSRRIHSDGRGREHSEVEMLDDEDQHPDVELQDAEGSTQKKLAAVKRSFFSTLKVKLAVLYLLFLAGITTRYILVTLEKEQLQNKYNKLSNNYSFFQAQLVEKCPEGWMGFGSSCYFKSTERKHWHDSRTDCQDKGADLVIINSKEEQKFVSELSMRGESWIGLHAIQLTISGSWKWKWEWVNGALLTET
ncbi:CD209 antigen-like protein D [Oreochromis niloticus]|uniref:CD209 antigen-like protein D n=1 Tax=Oreochromis niloticus TaxID=8128 RepID=A0A669BAP4_ORENI|nr:CD209 antigen-like protein D [Oreochromis niloticus]